MFVSRAPLCLQGYVAMLDHAKSFYLWKSNYSFVSQSCFRMVDDIIAHIDMCQALSARATAEGQIASHMLKQVLAHRGVVREPLRAA